MSKDHRFTQIFVNNKLMEFKTMKRRSLLVAAVLSLGAATQAHAVDIEYQVHAKNLGWMDWVNNGSVAGTTGERRRLEAMRVNLNGAPAGMNICYSVHMKNNGWGPAKCDGETAGTTGERRRIEAIRVWFENPLPLVRNVCYRVHMKNKGWGPLACNGEIAGTTGESRRIEAIEISSPPVNAFADAIQADVMERANGAELSLDSFPVYWTDTSYGCSNGGVYFRPVTPGWRFVFSDGVSEYNYHTWDNNNDGVADGYLYCSDPYTPYEGWFDREL